MAKFNNSNLVHSVNIETLSNTKNLSVTDAQMQFLDPNGTDRDVLLPPESDSEGIIYYISNSSLTYNLNIYEDSGLFLIGSVLPESISIFTNDTVSWYSSSSILGTGTDNRITRWNGISSLQDSNWLIDDNGVMSLNISGSFSSPSNTYLEINNNSGNAFISLGHNGLGGIYSHVQGEEGGNYIIFNDNQKRWLITAESGGETEIGDSILLTNGLIQSTIKFIAGNGTASSPGFSFTSDQNNGIYLSGTDSISISTNSTQRLLINNTGKIGINQSTASAYLDIAATGDGTELLYFRIDRAWFFKQQDTGSNAKLALQASTSDKQFRINAEDGDPVFLLQQSSGIPDNNIINLCPLEGRVSIGTLSPTSGTQLDVNGIIASSSGSVGSPSLTFRANLDTGLYNTTNKVSIAAAGNHVSTFTHNGTSPFFGIGTDAPSEAVSINYITVSDNCLIDINSASSFQSGIRLRDNNTTRWLIYQVTNTNLRFNNGSADIMYLTSTGEIELENGSVTKPSFSFNSDTNTGIYLIDADRLGLTVGSNLTWDITIGGTVITNRLSVGESGTNARYLNVDLFNPTFTHVSGSPQIHWGASGTVPTTFADQTPTASATGVAYIEIPTSTEVVMVWTLPLMKDSEVKGIRMRYTKTGSNIIAPVAHMALYAINDLFASLRNRVAFGSLSTVNVSNGTFTLTLGTIRLKTTDDSPLLIQLSINSNTSAYEIYSINVLYERMIY